MNHSSCTIAGRLTKPPHFKQSDKPNASGMCSFDVAFTTGFGDNEKTNYIRVIVFGKHGEACQKNLVKGQQVLVHGELIIQPWDNGAGKSGLNVECRNATVSFGAKPKGSEDSSGYNTNGGPDEGSTEPEPRRSNSAKPNRNDDDLPF